MSKPSKYTKEVLEEAVASSVNLSEVLRKLNANPAGNTRTVIKQRIEEFKILTDHFTHKPVKRIYHSTSYAERFLKKNPQGVRTKGSLLKKAMMEVGIDYKCQLSDCPNPEPIWKGIPLTLQVDHIDGDYTNNLKENLRFLCPNCHTQTETFGKKQTKYNYCECGKEIRPRSKKCISCTNKEKIVDNPIFEEKRVYPKTEELVEGVQKLGFMGYARIIGLSDNGLRKLLLRRGIKPLPKKLTKLELADSIV